MKKIIAREGLIILSIALLAFALFLMKEWFYNKADEILELIDDETYIENVMEKEIDKSELGGLTVPEYLRLHQLYLQSHQMYLDDQAYGAEYNYYKPLNISDIKTACTGEEKEQECQTKINTLKAVARIKKGVEKYNVVRQKKYATYRGYSDITGIIGLFVILLLYPLYLVIRFVIWAIYTLRRT